MNRPELTDPRDGQISSGQRLNSWKEIAAFVGRTEGTVQRWEQKEGMPVHRHQHGARGTVYAFTGEIDAWLATRKDAPERAGGDEDDASRTGELQAHTAAPATRPVGGRRRFWAGPLAMLGLVGAAVAIWLRGSPVADSQVPGQPPVPRRVTAFAGFEVDPALSPDGKRVAFAWQRPGTAQYDIYIKDLDSGEPVQVSNHPGDERFPRWSPTGTALTFVRTAGRGSDEQTIVTHSLDRNAEWVMGKLSNSARDRVMSFSYAPGSVARLWLVHRGGPSATQLIEELHTGTDARAIVAEPPHGGAGFLSFAVSPDGRSLAAAIADGRHPQPTEIWVRSLPSGSWRQLTRDFRNTNGLCWTPDSQSIVFSSDRGGTPALWMIRADSPERDRSRPVRITTHFEAAMAPSIVAFEGKTRLAYQIRDRRIHVRLQRLDRPEPPLSLTSGPARDVEVSLSPDGRQVAFVSDRSGSRQIWVVQADGSGSMRRLTSGRTWLGFPSWSSNSGSLLFLLGSDAATLASGESMIRSRTHGYRHSTNSGWVANGDEIHIVSNRSGSYQVWIQPVDDEAKARQVTAVKGDVASAHVDDAAKTVYFDHLNADPPGVWKVPLGGGVPTLAVPLAKRHSWKIRGPALFYLRQGEARSQIVRYGLGDGNERIVLDTPFHVDSFDISRDGATAAYSATDFHEVDIAVLDLPGK